MKSDALVSVVMVDGGFRESFNFIDTWLHQTLDSSSFELIWIEYTDEIAPRIQSDSRIRSSALRLSDEPQVLARAFNEGIRQAKGDILVFPDADVACEPDLLETIAEELSNDPEVVLYVLRLDQERGAFKASQTFDELKGSCTIKHTYNFGGCTAVSKKWLLEMNGYEELPIFAGYHYNGGDNYIRFKNLGLKIRWHPAQRVYHAWHPSPPSAKFATAKDQETFIRKRAASWDWQAFEGLDKTRNRSAAIREPQVTTAWERVITERGVLGNDVVPTPSTLMRRLLNKLRSSVRGS